MTPTVAWAPAPSRSTTTTFAPCRANATDVARPMPLPPPVTSATLPVKSISPLHPMTRVDYHRRALLSEPSPPEIGNAINAKSEALELHELSSEELDAVAGGDKQREVEDKKPSD